MGSEKYKEVLDAHRKQFDDFVGREQPPREATAQSEGGEKPQQESTMPMGTYSCPHCGKDSPHSHETKLTLALPRLFEQLHKQERLLLHLGTLYCNDPSLSLRQFNVDATVKSVRYEIAEVKAAYEAQMREPLTSLEGMTYDRED